jgi:hypothetical protein
VPQSRNTRIRPKNTSRAEARRRFRDDQRDAEALPTEAVASPEAEAPAQASMFKMPNVADDVRALPQVFRKKLVWLPFGLLLLTLVLSVALVNGLLDSLPEMVRNVTTLYISLTLHPTTLFIFFIGGFVAPRASYLVGGILGLLSAANYLIVVSIATDLANEAADAVAPTTGGVVPSVTSELVVQTVVLGLVVGVFAGGFAAWYRRFLRSSQERAAANRAAKEREQEQKRKEQLRIDRAQVRADKYAAREARRKGSA